VKYTIEQSNGSEIITLSGELTISCADELKEVLKSALSVRDQIGLNLEQVTEVDLSCLQLFCSAHRTSIRLDKKFNWDGIFPESLRNSAECAGFLRHIGCTGDLNTGCLWVSI
jgi:ABC-type transporter Mla MlaB component